MPTLLQTVNDKYVTWGKALRALLNDYNSLTDKSKVPSNFVANVTSLVNDWHEFGHRLLHDMMPSSTVITGLPDAFASEELLNSFNGLVEKHNRLKTEYETATGRSVPLALAAKVDSSNFLGQVFGFAIGLTVVYFGVKYLFGSGGRTPNYARKAVEG